MSPPRGRLSAVVHGEILHFGGSENDILVRFLDGWNVLLWWPIGRMVNKMSTQAIDRPWAYRRVSVPIEYT